MFRSRFMMIVLATLTALGIYNIIVFVSRTIQQHIAYAQLMRGMEASHDQWAEAMKKIVYGEEQENAKREGQRVSDVDGH